MTVFIKFLHHELLLSVRQPMAVITPLLFFSILVCLFAILFGNDDTFLQTSAPMVIWIGALLATLLSIQQLFQQDAQEGFVESMLLSTTPLPVLMNTKILAHWLMHGLPLVLLTPLLGMLLHLPITTLSILCVTLLLGTPLLSLFGTLGASLTYATKQQSLLLPVLIIPLYIPVLIFGVSALQGNASAYLALLAAMDLVSFLVLPILTATALRAGMN